MNPCFIPKLFSKVAMVQTIIFRMSDRAKTCLIMTNSLLGDPPWPSGYDAWHPSVYSQVRFSARSPSRLAWSLYECAALWRAVHGLSATERPLGTIREERGIFSRFRVSVSSQYELSCWKRRKKQFLHSFFCQTHISNRHLRSNSQRRYWFQLVAAMFSFQDG